MFQKSPKKQPSFKRPKRTFAQTALSSNKYALKRQRREKTLIPKSCSKIARMTKLLQFWQGHPKPAFSEKVQRGDQRKFFKNLQKGSLRLKGKKTILAHMALSSNQYALEVQRLEKILGKKSGSKSTRIAKLWQFLQGHPKHAFSEKLQWGDQGKFFKNRPKGSPRLKGAKATWRKWHYPLIGMHLKCILI